MQAAKTLKEKIDSGQLTTGAMASFHLWPDLVEIAMNAGLDYLIVDLEHGAFSDDVVANVCAMGRLRNFPIIIRPHANDFATVRKTLDLGPCGIMLAVVNNTAILDEARDGIYMPPRGKRRPGGAGNRWVTDYNYTSWRSEVEDNFIVLPQIETKIGIENAEAIAAHEITTAIAVGPYDLSADLGVCWQPDAPALVDALAKIRAAGEKAGKKMWAIGDGPTLVQRGFTFLCIAEPIMLLEATLKNSVANLKAGTKYSVPAGDKPLP